MDELSILEHFLAKATLDARIGIAHIGLYAVLFNCWKQQGFRGPVKGYASQIMVLAKISSTATYHRLIRQLHEYGYVCYQPSLYKAQASLIYLISKEERDECRIDYKGRSENFPDTTTR